MTSAGSHASVAAARVRAMGVPRSDAHRRSADVVAADEVAIRAVGEVADALSAAAKRAGTSAANKAVSGCPSGNGAAPPSVTAARMGESRVSPATANQPPVPNATR